jgi:hypothetical protein
MAIWTLTHNVRLRVERCLGRVVSIAEPRFLNYRRIFTWAKVRRSEPKFWMMPHPEVKMNLATRPTSGSKAGLSPAVRHSTSAITPQCWTMRRFCVAHKLYANEYKARMWAKTREGGGVQLSGQAGWFSSLLAPAPTGVS